MGLENVQIARQGEEVVVVSAGHVMPVAWPYGFSARLLNGKAEIVAPDGHLIGREGDTLGENLVNLGVPPDRVYHICMVSGPSYQWWPSGR